MMMSKVGEGEREGGRGEVHCMTDLRNGSVATAIG